MRRPSVGRRRNSSANRIDQILDQQPNQQQPQQQPQQLQQQQMEQSNNTQAGNLTSTDYQTDPTYQRGYSGVSQMSNINQEEIKDQQEQQQVQEEVDNYPVFDQKRLIDKYQTTFDYNNAILSMRYSNDDQYIATSQFDGSIKIFNVKKQNPSYALVDQQLRSACSAVRWCPGQIGLQNTLIASYADGTTLYWHTTSQKILHRYEEPQNPINALDISNDGLKFATAGQDSNIRIYDVGKKSEPQIFESSEQAPKHTNRVYGIKFDKNDPNLMISGGWDQMILLWDLRTRYAQGYIYGPKIYSDSFDINENYLLTGSWREKDQLQIYDLRKLKKLETIQWENYTKDKKKNSLVYCCQFNKNNSKQIVAGCTGTHEIRMFEQNQNTKRYECVDIFKEGLEKGVYCMDFSKQSQKQQFSYGCGDGLLGIIELENN